MCVRQKEARAEGMSAGHIEVEKRANVYCLAAPWSSEPDAVETMRTLPAEVRAAVAHLAKAEVLP